MRAFILGAVAVLALGSPVMAEEGCRTPQEVIALVDGQFGGESHAIYRGRESLAIKHGIERRFGITLPGDREFIVYVISGRSDLLVIGFKNGCFEKRAWISRVDLDTWLAEQGA